MEVECADDSDEFGLRANNLLSKKKNTFLRGVPTLRISVSGERQNLFGNLKILPGIGSLEKLFGKLQIILEYYIIYLEVASNFVLNQETSPFV